MSVVPVVVPSFVGGVSQLPVAQRPLDTLEALTNGWASPPDGLRKRQPLEHLATVAGDTALYPDRDRVLHAISRSTAERYWVDLAQDAITVYNTDTGAVLPVYAPDGSAPDLSYLSVRRRGFIDAPEPFTGVGWTITDGITESAIQRGPFDLGRARTLTATPAGDATWDAAHNLIPTAAPVGDTWGAACYFKQDPGANTNSRVALRIAFNTGGTPQAEALFRWTPDSTLELLSTQWIGAVQGTITTAVIDVGGGWFRAVLVVTTTLPVGALRTTVALTAGGLGRSVDVFGLQHLRNIAPTGANFPSYHLEQFTSSVRAATFADTTYVSNHAVSVALGPETTPDDPIDPLDPREDMGLVFIKVGGYDQRYTLTYKNTSMGAPIELTVSTMIDGNNTPPSDPADTTTQASTISIATAFDTLLTGTIGTIAHARGSMLSISTTDGSTIETLSINDSQGDTGSVTILHQVEAFEDLPTRSPDGYHVRVLGAPEAAEDDYHVVAVGDSLTSPDPCVWEEAALPNLALRFDPTTMPHQLVRKQDDKDGTITGVPLSLYFEWGPAPWADRLVGDDRTNRAATMVGSGISDIGFYRSRLLLVSDRAVLMSEVNDTTNLWRTTVRQLLDGDRIDIEVPDTDVSRLYRAVPTDRDILAVSDSAVYRISGQPLLTPSTIAADTAIQLRTDPSSPAVAFGSNLIAFGADDTFTTVYELYVPEDDRQTARAEELTATAQRYVPAAVRAAAASEESNALLLVAAGERRRLYAYQRFVVGGQVLQSAWWRHELPAGDGFLGVAFISRRAGLLVERGDKLYVETMLIAPSLEDPGLGYQVTIDRRVTDQVAGFSRVYDANTDTTAITVPYTFTGVVPGAGPGSAEVVTRDDGAGGGGRRPEVVSGTGAVVTVRGDYTTQNLYVGERYDLLGEMSRPVPKSGPPDAQTPATRGARRVESLVLQFEGTTEFDLVLKPPLRAEQRRRWRTPLGTGAVIGPAQLTDDTLRMHIGTSVEDAVVSFENSSPFPVRLIAAEFDVDVVRYSR